MNIYIVTNEYSIEGGGLAYSCHAFVNMLEQVGHDITIISSSVPSESIISGGYKPSLGYELAMEEKLKENIKSLASGGLIVSFGGGFNAYYAALLASKSRLKLWLMFRGSDANISKWNPIESYYNKFVVDCASEIFALSKEIADNVQLFSSNKLDIHVIPNSASRKSEQIKSISSRHITLGTGATHLNEKKGISHLLEMVAVVNRTMKDLHLSLELVGHIDNDVKELYKAKMDELCISSDVNFLGRLSRDEFRNRQMTWDMYVQTSVCEGMGNSVVDAMSMGLPIMISNTGYVAEAAQEHFPQIVFSSLNPHSMADELSILVSLKDRDFRYGNFYSMFFSGITPSKIASRWKQFLECDTPKTNFEYKPSAVLSLTLHDVSGDKHDNITTPVEVFESFVDRVHQKGLGLCSMKSYVQKSIDERERWIVCTFDDGYTGLLDNALPILNKYGFTASVYVCTDYLGKSNDWNFKDKSRRMHLNVEELKELICAGWEIGSHGVTHESLLRLDDADIEWQLKESKKILEELFGPVISYAYPYGDISPYIETQVKKYYDYAFLLTQGGVFLNTDAHKIHRYYISEINQIINGLLGFLEYFAVFPDLGEL